MAKPGDVVYSAQVHQRICDLVAEGSNLTQICQMKGMPNIGSVYRWLREDGPDAKPELRDDYARARQQRADSRADKIDAICEEVRAGNLAPDAARVIIDALKWQAGKEAPRYYGDRQQVDVSGKVEFGAVKVVHLPPGVGMYPVIESQQVKALPAVGESADEAGEHGEGT